MASTTQNGRTSPTAVPAVERAARILHRLAHGGPHTSAGLAEELGLAKSTVSDVCGALVTQQLVRRDDQGKYWLGGHLESLAATWVGGEATLQRFARECARLPALDGHTVTLHALHGAQTICLEVRLGTRPLPLTPRPGTRGSLPSTSAGQAIIAAMDEQDLEAALDHTAGFDGLDVAAQKSLMAEAQRLRNAGTAPTVNDGVLELAAAVPVGPGTKHWIAVTAVLPAATITDMELADVGAGVQLLIAAIRAQSATAATR